MPDEAEFREGVMKNRTLAWIALTLIVVTLLVLVTFPRDNRFNEACFDRIRDGMTMAEVESAVGVPAGDYRPRRYTNPRHFVSISDPIGHVVKESGRSMNAVLQLEEEQMPDRIRTGIAGAAPAPAKVTWRHWIATEWGIGVAFDENSLVIRRELLEIVPPRSPRDLLMRLKWYMGL